MEEMIEEMARDVAEVDIYLMNVFPFGVDFLLEFEKRYDKPMALLHFGSNDAIFVSSLTARGHEAYCWYNWDAAPHTLRSSGRAKCLAIRGCCAFPVRTRPCR